MLMTRFRFVVEGEFYPTKQWECKPYGPMTNVNLPYPTKSNIYEKEYLINKPYGPMMSKPYPPTMYPLEKECGYPIGYPTGYPTGYPIKPFPSTMYPLEKECGYPVVYPSMPEPNWHGEYPKNVVYGYGN